MSSTYKHSFKPYLIYLQKIICSGSFVSTLYGPKDNQSNYILINYLWRWEDVEFGDYHPKPLAQIINLGKGFTTVLAKFSILFFSKGEGVYDDTFFICISKFDNFFLTRQNAILIKRIILKHVNKQTRLNLKRQTKKNNTQLNACILFLNYFSYLIQFFSKMIIRLLEKKKKKKRKMSLFLYTLVYHVH